MPTVKNGWHIKFSIHENNILFVIQSVFTDQTIVRYFDDEITAVAFLNYLMILDPTKEWENL